MVTIKEIVLKILDKKTIRMPDFRKRLRYVPYQELGDTPNIIVDGAAADSTLLNLSHWPQNTTPVGLKRDTSAEIVFAYLDAPEYHVDVEVVSNNHFDQDGLVGLFALIDPVTAQQHRELLIDTASAGDFGVFERLDAARISFLLYALEDPARGFFKADICELSGAERDAVIYRTLLAELPEILSDLERYRPYWEPDEKHLLASLELLEGNKVTIVEKPELDLAIVQLAESLAADGKPGIPVKMDDLCHPYAIYSATPCNRIVLVCGQAIEFRYRYESWVQMVSRRPLLRASLTGLEEQLNQIEISGGVWRADSVDNITPVLRLDGSRDTSIPAEAFLTRVEEYLLGEPPAWDPYAHYQPN
jgi:hypothetical protein